MPEPAVSIEELRRKLYAWCGRSIACRRAADYYIMLIQNPCYPPMDKVTYRMHMFYIEFVKQYGPPPRCDVKKLVEERLRGTILEKYIHEIAEFAELLRRKMYITSRVAAATAAIIVAESHGVVVIRRSVATRFGASYEAVLQQLRKAVALYLEYKGRA